MEGQFASIILYVIIICFLIFIMIFCIKKALFLSKSIEKVKREQKEDKMEKGYIERQTMHHCAGLPIAENEQCEVLYCEDKIMIESNGAIFNLELNKVIDMTVTTDTEVQRQMVSSAGGAVAGALMFGVVGALIGGRAKTKEIKKVTYLLIITYEKEDKTEYIIFDLRAYGFYEPKMVQLFKQRPKLLKKQIAL